MEGDSVSIVSWSDLNHYNMWWYDRLIGCRGKERERAREREGKGGKGKEALASVVVTCHRSRSRRNRDGHIIGLRLSDFSSLFFPATRCCSPVNDKNAV